MALSFKNTFISYVNGSEFIIKHVQWMQCHAENAKLFMTVVQNLTCFHCVIIRIVYEMDLILQLD